MNIKITLPVKLLHARNFSRVVVTSRTTSITSSAYDIPILEVSFLSRCASLQRAEQKLLDHKIKYSEFAKSRSIAFLLLAAHSRDYSFIKISPTALDLPDARTQ
jgi:hypothetical protein